MGGRAGWAMGNEEGTCWDERWVLYGNQSDNKFHSLKKKFIFRALGWLTWLSVRLLILAQIMISCFMCSIPVLGSVLKVQSPLGILTLTLPLLLSHYHMSTLSLSLSKISKLYKKFIFKEFLVGKISWRDRKTNDEALRFYKTAGAELRSSG